jgi:hypothetical protein
LGQHRDFEVVRLPGAEFGQLPMVGKRDFLGQI